jgi:hypothetical protein
MSATPNHEASDASRSDVKVDNEGSPGESAATQEKSTLTEFRKVVVDLTRDLLITYPELADNMHPLLRAITNGANKDKGEEDKVATEATLAVYEHCRAILPEKFFDILYQNHEKLFAEGANDEFLPGIFFGKLWRENISEKTKDILWKYLQLLLFTVVGGLKGDSDGASAFGDTAQLFKSINQDEFKMKLEETVRQMQDMFSKSGASNNEATGTTTDGEDETVPTGINLDDIPNPADLQDHVNSMMKGKLGALAREIAEETAQDLNMKDANSVQDVFKNLMQNPTKLMGLVKNVGTKLEEKMKSGDMKESDLLKEASDIMQQMKGMPGMANMQSMFAKMGMDLGSMGMGAGTGNNNSKVNVNAMQANIQRSLSSAKQRERMKDRLLERQQQLQQQQLKLREEQAVEEVFPSSHPSSLSVLANHVTTSVFGEGAQRSSPLDKPDANVGAGKKKKNKHKK